MAGQFTQTDPIGIAGGLNTYGYANGDPINFSDPFGLSPCEELTEEEMEECRKGQEEAEAALQALEFGLVRHSRCLAAGASYAATGASDALLAWAAVQVAAVRSAVAGSVSAIRAAVRFGDDAAKKTLIDGGNQLAGQMITVTAERGVFRGASSGVSEFSDGGGTVGGAIERFVTPGTPGAAQDFADACAS